MPPLVVAGGGAEREAEVRLLGAAARGDDPRRGGKGRRRHVSLPVAGAEGFGALGDELDQFVVVHVAGGGDDGGAGDVVGREISDEIRPAHRVEGLGRADDRAAEGMRRELRRVQQVMHVFRRLVAVHRELLFDDVAFLGDLRRREGGAEEHVQQHVEQLRHARRLRAAVEAGMLLVGEGVQVAADALHRLRDLRRGAAARALEEQVLDEVGDAVEGCGLVASARAHPDAERDAGHVRERGGEDGQAVGQSGRSVHGGDQRAGMGWVPVGAPA